MSRDTYRRGSSDLTDTGEHPVGKLDTLRRPVPGLDDLVGVCLSERYRIDARIGSGAMGVVYRAEHLLLRRPVAVKVLPHDRKDDRGALQRLLNEARTLASIRHANIVEVFDCGITEGGTSFVVMEYLDGKPLDRLLTRGEGLPWPLARHITLQVLSGLAAAHERGIVHRDVKPSNCVCLHTKDGDVAGVKLLDFGIAEWRSDALSNESSNPRVFAGTPAYIAPEQVLLRPVDHRTDLYSVGVLLYELVTGELPFDGDVVADILRKHVDEAPPRLGDGLRSAVALAALEPIILRALEKDPRDRFQSAEEMSAAIAALPVEGGPAEPHGARPAPTVQPARVAGGASRSRDVRDLQQFSAKVARIWITGVLATNVSDMPFASQERTLERHLTASPWESMFSSLVGQTAQTTNEDIGTIFEAHDRELLITGPPGSGKTTAMLLLMKELVARFTASEGGNEPVPVPLGLAGFSVERKDLFDWIVDELRSKYRLPAATARRWIRKRRILPLLDGLDECAPALRRECVERINRFRREHAPPGLVVTSRLEEYLALDTRLELTTALRLHELTSAQVHAFLRAVGEPGAPLVAALESDPSLMNLVKMPLALGIMGVVSRASPAVAEEAPPATLTHAYGRYVATMLQRKVGPGAPPLEHVMSALRRLASHLTGHSQSVLLFEELQVTWLTRRVFRGFYLVLSRLLLASIFGASLILPLGLSPLYNGGFKVSIGYGLVFALATIAVTTTCFVADAFVILRNQQRAQPPGMTKLRYILRKVVLGVLVGVGLGGALFALYAGHPVPMFMGLQVGFLSPLFFTRWYSPRARYRDIDTIDSLEWSWSAFVRALPLAAALAVLPVIRLLWLENARAALCVGALVASIVLLVRSVRRRSVPATELPNAGIVNSIRAGVVSAIVFGAMVTAIFGFAYGPVYGALVGLNLGLWMGLWNGGASALFHYVLRFILCLEGQTEYRDTLSFDVAVEHLLLRRVGGGYMFIHQTFQQYLADSGGEHEARR